MHEFIQQLTKFDSFESYQIDNFDVVDRQNSSLRHRNLKLELKWNKETYRLKSFIHKSMQQSTFSSPTIPHHDHCALGFTGNFSICHGYRFLVFSSLHIFEEICCVLGLKKFSDLCSVCDSVCYWIKCLHLECSKARAHREECARATERLLSRQPNVW